MKDYNQEYFYVERDGIDIYPSLHYVKGGGNYVEVDMLASKDVTTKRIMGFDDSTLGDPQLADFHDLKHYAPVITERLKNVLESFNPKDTQFLPTLIRDGHDNEHDGYYILHVYNEIKSMDWEDSDWEKNRFNKEKASIERLVLDNEKIDVIPLEERLVFKVWEDSTHLLFHQSVVEKMLEIAPTGLTVYRLSEYDSQIPFIEEYMRSKGL